MNVFSNRTHKNDQHPTNPPTERVNPRPVTAPRVDVFENATELLVVADLPGTTKEDVKVHLEKGELTIEAQARRPPSNSGQEVHREFVPRDFHRAFVVPRGIDATKIEAELNQGVLRLRLPKSDALRPRQIEVKGG